MKKILMSLLTIAIVGALITGGVMAYFMDRGTSTGNTFTAANLDIKLKNKGGAWEDDVTGTWTFEKMCPGNSVGGWLYVYNAGEQPIKCLLMDMDIVADKDKSGTGTGQLDKYLCITKYYMEYKGTKRCPRSPGYDLSPGKLLVKDYVKNNNLDPCSYDDIIAFCSNRQEKPGQNDYHYGWPQSLKPRDWIGIYYEFTFWDNGENQSEAMGDSLTIKYTLEARSSPCPCLPSEP